MEIVSVTPLTARLKVFCALSLIVSLLISQTVVSQTPGVADVSQAGVPEATWPRLSYPRFHTVAASAGIEALRTKEPSDGTREIRVWIDGSGSPNKLYRLVENETSVFGELIFYWLSTPREDEAPRETFHDLIVYSYMGSCDRFFNTGKMATCRALFDEQPDWEAALRAAERSGLWELPDSSELPSDGSFSTGGWGITVELHDGEVYRTYQYSNPQHRTSWSEAAHVTEIANIFRSIRDQVRPADIEGIYRGITTGEPGSAFSLCGRDTVWMKGFWFVELAEMAGLEVPEPGVFGYVVSVVGKPTPEWVARENELEFSQILHSSELVSIAPAYAPACD